jgi:hypothetical protein
VWFNSYVYSFPPISFARIIDASGSSVGQAVACDSSGNLYIAGSYTKFASIETQDGTFISTLPNVYGNAAFVSKFNKSGTYQYSRIIDSTNTTSDWGFSVACDSSGNMYISGAYGTASPTIKDQNANILGTLPETLGGVVAFVSKFDSSGTYQYSRIVDGTGNEYGYAVTCDSSGNMYFGGSYATASATIRAVNSSNVSSNVGTLPAPSGITAFVSKFDSNGTYQYSRVIEGVSQTEQVNSISCDNSNNMYFCGYYRFTNSFSNIVSVNTSNVATTVATLPISTAASSDAAFVCKFDSSGTYQYSSVIEGTSTGEYGQSLACDSSGNMYLAGYYGNSTPTIIFRNSSNVSSNVATLPAPVTSNSAAFVCKFNSSGTYQYSRTVDGAGSEIGYGLACDSSGNMYITGQYSTASPLIRAVTSSNVTSNVSSLPAPSASSVSSFLSKFDSSGNYQFSRIIDGTGSDYGYGVTTDSSGYVYLTGQFAANSQAFIKNQGGAIIGAFPALQNASAFVVKFDSNGGLYSPVTAPTTFARIVDGSGNESVNTGNSLTCDSSGNMYFTGYYNTTSPTIKDQYGGSIGTLPNPLSINAGFVSKFDSSGVYQYSRLVDTGANGTSVNSVACDSSGNMYIAGRYTQSTPAIYDQNGNSLGTLPTPSSGTSAGFLSKFDSNGNYQYSRIIDGSGNDYGFSVACDSSGNVYLGGWYNPSTATIKDQDGNSLATLPTASSSAAFVSKFNSSGTYQYSRVVDGTSSSDSGYSVTTDSSGNMYLAGQYGPASATIKYVNSSNVTTNIATLPVPTGSGTGAFVCKFDSSGTYQYSRLVDGTGTKFGYSVACDSSGNIYLAGYYDTSASTIRYVDSSNVVSNVATLPSPIGSSVAFACKFDSSGTYQYSRLIDGTSNDIGYSVACDSSGNMYLTGFYQASSFIRYVDSSNVVSNVATLRGPSSASAFVCKFNSSGNYLYSRTVDGGGADYCFSVTCDSSGNMYLSGEYRFSASIYSINSSNVSTQIGTLPLVTGATSNSAAYVIKFDSNGNYNPVPSYSSVSISSNTFARIVDGTGIDSGYGVTTDSSGNIYLAGAYSLAASILKDQNGTTIGTLPAPTSYAAFVSKFNSSGTYQYSRIVDGIGNEFGYSVACDSSGNMYLAGLYGSGAPTLKDQNGTSLGTLPAPSGGTVAFVSKFDSSGTYQYSRIVDGGGNEFGRSVACDSSGNMYLAGYYDTSAPTIYNQNGTSLGTLPAPSSGAAVFACKFDSSGNYLYSRIVDGTGNDFGYSVACDSSGNMYIAGYYSGSSTIKDQAGTGLATLPTPIGGQSAFVCKFDSSGTYQYSRLVDSTNNDLGQSLACDSSGNMYLAGYYTTTTANIRYASSSNVFSNVATLPTPIGGESVFVCKFDSSGTYQYSRIVDGTGSEIGYGVACDSSGNMYIGGAYGTGLVVPTIRYVTSSNVVSNVATLQAASSTYGAFVSKFDSSGTYQYSRLIDGAANDYGWSVACDSSGNMYFSGEYLRSPIIYSVNTSNVSNIIGYLPQASGDTANAAAFVIKFDSSGNYNPVQRTSPATFARIVDGTGNNNGFSVACDSSGNMYIGGSYDNSASTIKTQAGTGIATLPAPSSFSSGFVSKFDSSGNYLYSRVVDGASSSDDYVYSVACDSSGNMYLAGFYSIGSPIIRYVNSSNVSTNISTLPVPIGTYAAYVSKFDSSGTYQYSRVIDATSDDFGYSVACDSSNNMYLAGYYSGSAATIRYVNSSNVVSNVATLPTTSTKSTFVSKFDSSGTYQYSRVVDGSGDDYGYSVACDSSNNIYVAGYYTTGSSTIRYVNSSNVVSNVATLPVPIGNLVAYVSKFDSSGTYQYSRIVDGTGSEIGYSVACDSSGNMYLAGFYSIGSPIIRYVNSSNVVSNVATLPAPLGSDVAFVSKFDSSGTYQYSRIVDGGQSDTSYSVTCDSSGNMYFTGYYYSTAPTIRAVNSSNVVSNVGTLPSALGNNTSAFICKFDSSGTYQYSRVLDNSAAVFGRSVACDSYGNMYFTGYYGNSTTTIRAINTSNVATSLGTLPASVGTSTAVVIKFGPDGTYFP